MAVDGFTQDHNSEMFDLVMSLRLVIPWPVALQQSSPPLHQPTKILNQKC